jgi:hypothetical protein
MSRQQRGVAGCCQVLPKLWLLWQAGSARELHHARLLPPLDPYSSKQGMGGCSACEAAHHWSKGLRKEPPPGGPTGGGSGGGGGEPARLMTWPCTRRVAGGQGG